MRIAADARASRTGGGWRRFGRPSTLVVRLDRTDHTFTRSFHPMSHSPPTTCGARRAASLVGFAYPGQFNAARKSLERVVARDLLIVAYPDFGDGYSPVAVWGDEYDPRRHRELSPREAEALFRRTRTLVVPEWGGIRLAGSEWTYDEDLCASWRRRMRGDS